MGEGTTNRGTAPVVERVICLQHAPLTTEVLSEKLPTWSARIADHYPDAEPVSDWKLVVPMQNGTPDFTHVRPELSLRHRFWGPGVNGEKTWCMQCLSNAVIFNVIREKDAPHGYHELKQKAMGLLGEWSDHFEVRRFVGVEIRYVNRLNAELTPQFMNPEGRLLIGQAFKLFSSIPIPDATILPPYDCTITLQKEGSRKEKLTVRVVAEARTESPGVAVHLSCNIVPTGRDFDCPDVGNALDTAHDSVQDAFRRLFTEEALKSFGLLP